MIGQSARYAMPECIHRQRIANPEQKRPISLKGENGRIPLPEFRDQRRLTMEKHREIMVSRLQPIDAYRAASSRPFRQIGWLVPLKAFHYRSDPIRAVCRGKYQGSQIQ